MVEPAVIDGKLLFFGGESSRALVAHYGVNVVAAPATAHGEFRGWFGGLLYRGREPDAKRVAQRGLRRWPDAVLV